MWSVQSIYCDQVWVWYELHKHLSIIIQEFAKQESWPFESFLIKNSNLTIFMSTAALWPLCVMFAASCTGQNSGNHQVGGQDYYMYHLTELPHKAVLH